MRLPEENIAALANQVGIGEHAVGGVDDSYRVTLGSCVAVCLIWARVARFAVAHVLLPNMPEGNTKYPPSRFADTVIPFLLEEIGSPERNREISAYIAGGGELFATDGVGGTVGPANAAAVINALQVNKVRLAGSDLGDPNPRQLVMDGPTRQVISLCLTTPASATCWSLSPHFGPRLSA